MTKKKNDKNRPSIKRPVANLVPPAAVVNVDDVGLEIRKHDEIVELVWLPASLPEEKRNQRLLRALELYEDLKPSGSAEGMLAAQMVGTHSAALECLRCAALADQTFEGQKMAFNNAQKLMTLYTKQLAALDKHRGKGQQKVTVEHVHVAAGGQAIVGNVEAGTLPASKAAPDKDLIEHRPEIVLTAPKSKSRAKSRKPGK